MSIWWSFSIEKWRKTVHSSKRSQNATLSSHLTYKLPEGKLIIVDAKYKDVFAQDSSNTLSQVSEDDPNAKIDLFSNHEFPIKPRVADIYQMAAYLDNRPDADAGFLVYPWLEKTQKLIWVDGCGEKKIGLLAIGICSS